jgi:hypothetical protein
MQRPLAMTSATSEYSKIAGQFAAAQEVGIVRQGDRKEVDDQTLEARNRIATARFTKHHLLVVGFFIWIL